MVLTTSHKESRTCAPACRLGRAKRQYYTPTKSSDSSIDISSIKRLNPPREDGHCRRQHVSYEGTSHAHDVAMLSPVLMESDSIVVLLKDNRTLREGVVSLVYRLFKRHTLVSMLGFWASQLCGAGHNRMPRAGLGLIPRSHD